MMHVFNGFFSTTFKWLFLILLYQGLASSEAQELSEKGAVKLATGEGYAPFVGENLLEGGWSVDVVKQTFKQLKLDMELEVVPWERALKWTQDKHVLAAFPFVYSEARAQQFLYSNPINYVPVHMYVAQNSDFLFIEQLKGKRLCFPFDYSIGAIEKIIIERFNMNVNRAKDGFACIQHVNKGWSDAGITNGYIDATRINAGSDEKEDSIRVFDELLGNIPLYLVISKQYPQGQKWIEEFNHGLKLLESSGKKSTIDKLHMQNL
ncbi:MAG: transporter substrate-binding domain-containing protein [Paraglaciecola sp.]|uniref:substrate-binding periplasmic protein n=1 Tax=Paraglaciecola sp. TaxID=1920173 RepID=UPI003264FB1C